MQRQQLMKWSIAVGKIAVFALLVWFVWATLVKAFQDLEHHTWHVAWPWLVAAGIFYILGTLPAGDFWSRLLRDCEQPIGRYTAIRAFLISQVGKYVPGKAMVIVVRAGLV
ncbi:MAG TPA: hypothetical protein VMF30_03445, partial [Pirellulales bacterium]|nr:hypothetical protein [Pirellulales bacterium]